MSLWDKEIEDMTPQENFEHFNYDLIPAYMNVLTDEQKARFMNYDDCIIIKDTRK